MDANKIVGVMRYSEVTSKSGKTVYIRGSEWHENREEAREFHEQEKEFYKPYCVTCKVEYRDAGGNLVRENWN